MRSGRQPAWLAACVHPVLGAADGLNVRRYAAHWLRPDSPHKLRSQDPLGRSGNRCGLCRMVLVADRTDEDSEAVVGGRSAHRGAKPRCPRYGECDPSAIDAYDNLILLCKVHKLMDAAARLALLSQYRP
jgi:hypothetical protein